MNELFATPELISAIKAGLLGLLVGGIFAVMKFNPPSPDNLSGIFGIIGIFLGWILVNYLLN